MTLMCKIFGHKMYHYGDVTKSKCKRCGHVETISWDHLRMPSCKPPKGHNLKAVNDYLNGYGNYSNTIPEPPPRPDPEIRVVREDIFLTEGTMKGGVSKKDPNKRPSGPPPAPMPPELRVVRYDDTPKRPNPPPPSYTYGN